MISAYEQIQVLYEISLSIGEGNTLKTIARNALSAYLRKLNCSTGAILQKIKVTGESEYYKTIVSIPLRIDKNALFQEAVREIPMCKEDSISKNIELARFKQVDDENYFYIFDLPEFGVIVLTKTGNSLPSGSIPLLEPLNRKLAQTCLAELAKQKDLLQSVALSNTANAIVITNLEGIIEWVNPSWCSLTCYSKEDAVGNPIRILNSGYQDLFFYKELWDTILSGNVWRGEIINKRKDGNLYLEETTITPIINAEGKITNFVGVNQDITERKDMENKLRESEEKFRSIIENANDGIYLRNLDGVITFANEKFAQIHGYTLSEVIGRKSWEFLHPDDLKKIESDGELRKVQKGEYTEGEERGLTKSGETIYLDIRTAPLMIDLKIIGIFGIIRDITNRKNYEEKIRESEERFKSMADLLPQPIWETNVEGYYAYTNKAGYQQFGYSDEDMKNKVYFSELIAPENRKEAMQVFLNSYKEKDFSVKQYTCITKSGKRFPALIYYDVLLKEGKPAGMRGITVDITDLKQTQEKLIESQKRLTLQNKNYELLNQQLIHTNKELIVAKELAEIAEKAQSDFLSTMSHEIRTPMNAVVGLTNILLAENPQEHQVSNLKTLKFSSQNLLNIINNILDFNKLESDNVIIENIDFKIKEVVDGIYFAMKPMANEKGIDLDFYIDKNIPKGLVGDSTRLVQILNNLVSNCIKFTNVGGVTVRIDKIKDKEKDIWVRFEVSDTGIGIKKKNITKIFEAFKQAENNTARIYGGTGLGLPIVKKMLELQNSQIHVKSKIGVGSQFYFELKYRIGEEVDENLAFSTTEEEDASLMGISILVVEDNKINQIVVKQFLERWGCQPEFADNGMIALEKISQTNFDVVLMDLQMPEMDGYQATKKIRKLKNKNQRELPIIALSASALKEIKDKTKKIGMDGFVTKPFVPIQLFNAIKNAAINRLK
ncbi:MAG: PAS domain S-box protein [Bacteroidales bacterium]|nr:PAS domain S-box protein [Bacteroidales bacterium]